VALIEAADLNTILDACVLYAKRAIGTEAEDLGIGEAGGSWGAAGAAQDVQDAVLAMTDLEPVSAVAASVLQLIESASGIKVAAGHLGPLLSALQVHGTRFGLPNVTSLEGLLTYYNTVHATKWGALQAPLWRDLFQAWLGTSASPWNVYFEAVGGDGLRKLIVGTGETAGDSIDGALYAGGFPKLAVSGLSGSGTVTVTGSALDPATRQVSVGRTWTASVTVDGTVALAPGGGSAAAANSLILACTLIEAAGGISAGTIVVEAHRPTGRPDLS